MATMRWPRSRQRLPDILLTDIEMPGLSGIDVAAAISAEELHTRTIVVTTFGRPGYLARARNAGVRGYLLKDAPFEELLSSIRRVAGGGEAVSPALATASRDVDPDPLNDRERDVLRLAEQGLTNRDIASRLGLALGTIRNYLSEARPGIAPCDIRTLDRKVSGRVRKFIMPMIVWILR